MARMKFLCDADRCIECNACVTACKNEHEVPWGINRRRVVTINDGKPGERSVSMACMHCTDAPCAAVCPVNCFYTTADAVVLHSKDLCIGCGYCFYACPFGAPQYPQGRQLRLARQDGQVHLLRRRAGGGRHARRSTRSTAPTGWPKASCRCAPRCARPSRCSPATARSSRRSTRSAWSSAATAPAPGAGRRPIARRSRREARGVAVSREIAAASRAREARERSHGDARSRASRVVVGALGAALLVALAPAGGAPQQPTRRSTRPPARSRSSSCCKQLEQDPGPRHHPGHASPTCSSSRAGRDWRAFPRGHAALDRRDRDSRHARRCWCCSI